MFIKWLLIVLLLFNTSAFAADSTVSALTAASALDGTELYYCVQSGADRKCTGTQIKTLTSSSPTLVTPVLGVATATSINGLTLTSSTGTLTITNSKVLTASNTITLTATDGSTLAIGGGGTLGSNAYTSTAFAPLASPTFTGNVVIPTPFTLGAISVTSTGTQLNYLNAASGTTGTASSNVVFSASPTFTGTVTHPTPFTLGAVSVTTTGTQLNFLSSAGGTTGTTSTNIVFSTSPTLVTPTLGAATATTINGVTIDNNAWSTFSSSAACGNNALTVNSAKQKTIGKVVFWEIDITLNATIGSCTSVLTFSMPNGTATSAGGGAGSEFSISGKGVNCYVVSGGTSYTCRLSDVANFSASGHIIASGVYEN